MEKNDNKNKQIIILVLIIFALIVVGCFATKNKKEPSNENEMNTVNEELISETTDEEEDTLDNDENIIESVTVAPGNPIYLGEKYTFSQTHKYTDTLVETYTDNIELPYINIDSDDARKVNSDLKKKFDAAKASLNVYDEYSFSYNDMNYNSYVWKDRVLSVLIEDCEVHVPGEGRTKFSTYNFDLTTGKQLTNKELFEIIGIEDIDKTIKDSLTDSYYEGRKEMQDDPSMTHYLAGAYDTVNDLLNDVEYDIDSTHVFIESEEHINMNLTFFDIIKESKSESVELIKY